MIPRPIARMEPDICEIGIITINPKNILVIILEMTIFLCLNQDNKNQDDKEKMGVNKLTTNLLRVIPSISIVLLNTDLMELNQKKDTKIITITNKILFFISKHKFIKHSLFFVILITGQQNLVCKSSFFEKLSSYKPCFILKINRQ